MRERRRKRCRYSTRFCIPGNVNVTLHRGCKSNYLFQPISSRNAFRLKACDQVSARIARIVKKYIDFIDQTETFIPTSASSCRANVGIRSCFSRGGASNKDIRGVAFSTSPRRILPTNLRQVRADRRRNRIPRGSPRGVAR